MCSRPLFAQSNYKIRIINNATNQSVPHATVQIQPGNRLIIANSTGVALLPSLANGKYTVECSAVGLRNGEISINIPASDTIVSVRLDQDLTAMQDVIVTSARTDRLLKNTPLAVQVVGQEDIEEGTAESPANIRELLTELSGTQMQQTSSVSGNVSIRLQGLDGRYTQLLKDGFPLYGGFSGSLSILQIPPLDLKQVEVIKGAGSAFYGGDAIAGIINLVSRTPDTALRLDAIVNQTNKRGTNIGAFLSKRNKHTGFTLMGSASRQMPVDVNKDGFTDIPRILQGLLAPTFFWYPNDSTTLRLGLNISSENRIGGDLYGVQHDTDSLHPFRQQNRSDRDYYQFSLEYKAGNHQVLTLKNTAGYFYRSIDQTVDQSGGSIQYAGFSGPEISSFTEGSYSALLGDHQLVAGFGLNTDQFKPRNAGQDLGYSYNTVGLFAQDDWNLNKSTVLEVGTRADWVKTLYFLPRFALLFHPVSQLSIRIGGGFAYKLPTVFNATDEEDAYQQVYPIASTVKAERSASANLSFNYQGYIDEDIHYVVDQNFYYTRLNNALIPQTDSLQKDWLYYLNAPGALISHGSETNTRFSLEDFSLYLGYTYINARQIYLPGKPQLTLTPKNRFVSTFTYEAEPNWKVGTEGFFTGNQVLDNGQRTPAFWTFDLMTEYTWKHCSFMVNLENFTDTRQSKFGPLFTQTIQNPVFNEVFAPLDGRVISIAFHYHL